MVLLSVLAGLVATTPAGADSTPTLTRSGRFTLFESGQVRPLALSPSGKLLFAANTPDNRLEVFRIDNHGLEHRASIPVGLEPVAVAARNDNEIWVVNHLSDSVSVVALAQDGQSARVVRTLLVGDEPRDIVFGGPGKNRAFITTAHRGQNVPFDPQLTTPGVGRADVWVFDADHLGGTLGGTPITIVTLFSDTPRALAVSPDGSKRLRRGVPLRQPHHDHPRGSRPERRSSRGGRARARHRRQWQSASRGGDHRQVQRHPLGGRAQPGVG